MKTNRCVTVVVLFLFFALSAFSSVGSFSNIYDDNISRIDTATPIVLVTGFEPFDIYDINPSGLIARTLDGQYIGGAEIVGIILPVDFDKSIEVAIKAINDHNPVVVINLGLSASANKIEVEKCGLNLRTQPRNNSLFSLPRRLDPSGPFIHISPLPTKEIVQEIRKAGIPARQSFFAGIYVCNAVMYGVLGFIDEYKIPIEAGFIHVPLLSSQDPGGMDLNTMVEAVKLTIKTILQ